MRTRSRTTNLVQRLFSKHPGGKRYGQWLHCLLIAEVVLLILVAGSVVFVVAWDMFQPTQPLPTSTAILSFRAERSLTTAMTITTPCTVRNMETASVQSRVCISEY